MLRDPSNIIPLDPEEFLAALQYAGMVAENEFLEEIPGFTNSRIGMPDGTYVFKKEPFILFGFAAQRYFRNEPDKLTAFMRRLSALKPLLHRDEMKPYLRGAGDERETHLALFEVAASEKLVNGFEFDPDLFFRRVRQVAAQMESDGPAR